MISVTIKDANGVRSTSTFHRPNDLIKALVNDRWLTEQDEILVVGQDGMCLYSALCSINDLSIEDLVQFFS